MTEYQFTTTAQDELHQILHYIADHEGPGRALNVHATFCDAFSMIAAPPHVGTTRQNLTGGRLRWHHVFRWVVIYDPEPEPLTILRIIHSARDIARLLHTEH